MNALLLLMQLLEPVSYPLGPLPVRNLVTPAQPASLADLRYGVQDAGGRGQTFAAKVRLTDRGYLGAEVDDSSWGVSLETFRLDISAFERDGQYDLASGYRLSWLRASVDATKRREGDGGEWLFDARAAVRVTDDLEILAGVLRDTDRERALGRRHLDNLFAGILYQGGAGLEVRAELARFRVLSTGGLELEGEHWSATGAGRAWTAELRGRLIHERSRGRLGHHETAADAGVSLPLAGHLVVEAESENRWQEGAGRFQHGYAGAVTFHGRRVVLARLGRAAAGAAALARRANRLGYNVRRAYDDDGRRALRERLSLAPGRADLAADLFALHRLEIAERQVPQLGASYERRTDLLRGERSEGFRVFAAAPWPASWPFSSRASSARFLRLDYTQTERRYEPGLSSTSRSVSLTLELNREMELFARWARDGQTPLQIVQNVGRPRTLEFAYRYAFGR